MFHAAPIARYGMTNWAEMKLIVALEPNMFASAVPTPVCPLPRYPKKMPAP